MFQDGWTIVALLGAITIEAHYRIACSGEGEKYQQAVVVQNGSNGSAVRGRVVADVVAF